ncbi:cell division protein ZapE [Pseudomonas sp. JM0905a]|uniref:cell division protein ZapE n=1 Tax=Pseudomonas sp. JM0905a TaxID=2772484 RepID=UPI00168587F8|nr:cell division protein ZapE [Pseudomonas sp. JM0905a]MBD2840438.1 cell division protein ZapE [Pseudomonas sp. JM0905a]
MTSRELEPSFDALSEPAGQRIERHFDALLEARGYRADAAQRTAIGRLGQWLESFLAGKSGWLRRPPAGLYLWGGVGRGKSFVMDAFFAAAPLAAKRRVHFHAFLQELQGRMRDFAGQPDPLALAARALAEETRLLCFDEFHVHDIGDAVLLGRLLKVLVEEGVGMVCTSNYHPDGLCPNPLYRERFKPAIALIEKRFDVLNLDGGEDYRQRRGVLEAWGRYCWPLSGFTAGWIDQQLGLTPAAARDVEVAVNHHPLRVRAMEDERAWLDFDELCRRPHSSADFLWLSQRFGQLAISGVPCLGEEAIDVQQRFVNLIDIAYDAGIRLLLASEASLEDLCRGKPHMDFSRTRSRLQQLEPVQPGQGSN